MAAERLSPQTVNTDLSLLGTILNAAVDYLPRSTLLRRAAQAHRVTRKQPVPRREVWLAREQVGRLVAAIDQHHRALVLVAALVLKLVGSAYLHYVAFLVLGSGSVGRANVSRPLGIVQAIGFQCANPKAWDLRDRPVTGHDHLRHRRSGAGPAASPSFASRRSSRRRSASSWTSASALRYASRASSVRPSRRSSSARVECR